MWLQVHARRTGLLRSAADGEWVPLVLGDLWDVDVDVISRFELEELRTSDHQVSHLKVREKFANAVSLFLKKKKVMFMLR